VQILQEVGSAFPSGGNAPNSTFPYCLKAGQRQECSRSESFLSARAFPWY
jgi:hypothetical protein